MHDLESMDPTIVEDDKTQTVSPAGGAPRGSSRPDPNVGTVVGSFVLKELLGRGGMGAVYRAERTHDVEQEVALKLLTRQDSGPVALERFRRERQILAHLKHPNIAHFLDGGTTPDGRPYLVMSLVEGVPIDTYCQQARLTVRERLELVLPLLDALQFAHNSLVIHRDLKPSNVLVTPDGIPMLLDFGVAKLLEDDGLRTVEGGSPMTPGYASPEQLLGSQITTATDIYSMGVVLYQLLTGSLPLKLDSSSPLAALDTIRNTEPTRPSDQLTRDPGSARNIGYVHLRTARGHLRGDLDAIVLKCLRKERQDRYGSVDQLKEDVRRHLIGEPVTAHDGTFLYRVKKYARRHRWGLSVTALVLGLILSFVWVLSQQLRETEVERDRAQWMLSFMSGLFDDISPPELDREPTIRELIDQGRNRLEDEMALDPLGRAELLNTMGRAYYRLGRSQDAEEIMRLEVEALRAAGEEGEQDLARALNNLGSALYQKGSYAEAEGLFRESISLREQLGLSDRLNKPRANLSTLLKTRGQLDEAAELQLQVLLDRKEKEGARDPLVARSLLNLGHIHFTAGRCAEAAQLIEEGLSIRLEQFDPDSFAVATALANLARIRHCEGDLEEAERLFREALRRRLKHRPDNDPSATKLRVYLAEIYNEQGDGAIAGVLLHQSISALQQSLPEHHLGRNVAESIYGAYLSTQGRRSEAEVCLRNAVEQLTAISGPNTLQSRRAHRRLLELDH